MAIEPKRWGLTSDLIVNVDDSLSTVEFSGLSQGEHPFQTTMTKQAARILWYRLTKELYPTESTQMTTPVNTAVLRGPDGAPMTVNIRFERLADGDFLIHGSTIATAWEIIISETDAQRLWAVLDVMLHPSGWRGREVQTGE